MSRRIPFAAVLAIAVAAPATATAQAPAPAAGTVVAGGNGTVTPKPGDRTSNDSIAKAVAEAQAAALPLAIRNARARAKVLAEESGLTLGALTGIADNSPFFFGPFGENGTFGPGRFCGNVGRFRTTRLASGRVMRTRIGTRRQCRVPSRIVTTVTLTFATSGPPAA